MTDSTGAAPVDVEDMFRDSDPQLHRNKQLVYRFLTELMQAGHWENMHDVLSERYIQHNPLAEDGPEAVKSFFVDLLGLLRQEEVTPLALPVTAVIAQGDMVVIMMPIKPKHPNKPGETYLSTWFDAWRIVDGRLDEHWDGMQLMPGLSDKEMALANFSPP